MKDQPNPNESGPLAGRNCETCGYTAKLRLTKTDINATLVCAEGPPQMVPSFTPQGVTLTVMQPPVNASMTCFRHRTREEIAAKMAAEISAPKVPVN